jgi:RNA polymerase sigma-32 factor
MARLKQTSKRKRPAPAASRPARERDEERPARESTDDGDGDSYEAQVVDDGDGLVRADPTEDTDLDMDAVAAEVVEDEELERAAPLRRGAALAHGAAPLARYDPLQAYMRDVQRYKLLTPEEEKEAATKYFETGDVDAAAKLVTANLRLVVKIAYDYRRAHKNIGDLIQEGSIGLMQAVKKYDPYKGVKLSTYSAWWIRAYILRFILNNARLVKVGTTQAQRKLFFNLRKEKSRTWIAGSPRVTCPWMRPWAAPKARRRAGSISYRPAPPMPMTSSQTRSSTTCCARSSRNSAPP